MAQGDIVYMWPKPSVPASQETMAQGVDWLRGGCRTGKTEQRLISSLDYVPDDPAHALPRWKRLALESLNRWADSLDELLYHRLTRPHRPTGERNRRGS